MDTKKYVNDELIEIARAHDSISAETDRIDHK